MAIQQKLQTRLSQKLILTPSLQQAIKLLPMSTLELVDLLNQEVVENPLLEETPEEDLAPAEQAEQAEKAAADAADGADGPEAAEAPDAAAAPDRQDTWDDADYEYFFGDYLDDGYRSRAPMEVRDLPPIENTLSASGSLADHLRWQLLLQTDDDRLREMGLAIIGNLDDNGYLVASVDEIAAMGQWPEAEVEQALERVQMLDPVGVAARDLRECLLLQIRQRTDAGEKLIRTKVVRKIREKAVSDDLIGKQAVKDIKVSRRGSSRLEVNQNLIGKEAAKDVRVSRRTSSALEVSAGLIGQKAAKDISVSARFYNERHRDACAVLKVPLDVDEGELKSAHRRGARETHPDKNPDAGAKAFTKQQDAYETLTSEKGKPVVYKTRTVVEEGKKVTSAAVEELYKAGVEKIDVVEIVNVTLLEAGEEIARATIAELRRAGVKKIDIAEIADVTLLEAGEEIARATIAELRRAGVKKIDIVETADTADTTHDHHGRCETCEAIVRDHLPLLQNRQLPDLARRLEMSLEALKEHVEVLRRLDPKPGSRLNPVRSHYVIPDVSVIKVEDEYVAVLNEDGMPQLRISPVYRRMMSKSSQSSEETRAYVKEKFRSALWLIKSVDQRQKTIHKVANSIIRFQRGFLDHGIEHLRPLVLREVADDIGMHESTVSRVVTNKYMHTPQGVFELKYFFHSGIHSCYGRNVSSITIKQRIRKIVDQEDARKPLSDSRIGRLLQEEGLMLARRTIAKYREELKIPTSSRRKLHY